MSKTENETNENFEVDNKFVDGTNVYTSIAYTRNLGNFESVKLTVGLGRPLKTDEHPTEAFRSLYDLVTDALSEQVEDTRKSLG